MLTWLPVFALVNLLVAVLCVRRYRHFRSEVPLPHSLILRAVQVPTYFRSLSTIAEELSRARRYKRCLSVAVVQPSTGSFSRSGFTQTGPFGAPRSRGNTFLQRAQETTFLFVGSIVEDALRAQDIVTYRPERNQYVLVLVESDRLQATRTLDRIRDLVRKRTQLELVGGVAEFPAGGLIIEDLVRRAEQACATGHGRMRLGKQTVAR
ncbi:MAG: hypothetical protein ACE5JX_00135 [Acidobacteriota bacterium]